MSSSVTSPVCASAPPGTRLRSRAAAFCVTIRGRIVVAFLVMSTITAALGAYASYGIQEAGILVDKMYDESLMSINYARAAAADFNAIRGTVVRYWTTDDPSERARIDAKVDSLTKTLSDDLAVAAQRAQSKRAADAVGNVGRAVSDWHAASARLRDPTTSRTDSWKLLDRYGNKVDEEIDLLVNYTAGDGFLYRQSARATVARDLYLNLLGTLLALLLSAMVAWALIRRVVGPVADASDVAQQIATGKLDVVVPKGSADELGALLSSMGLMRDNIKAMMGREVAQRQTAQSRLADALQSSQEGIVVVDSDDRIALANEQASHFLGVSSELFAPGKPIDELQPALEDSIGAARHLLSRGEVPQANCEALLPDGRWLRLSHSATRDHGFIVVCSDISLSKQQEANLLQTNQRLDAALDNMSQGLCLFDAEDRLQVVNRRFFEIFGLSRDWMLPGITYREILESCVAGERHNVKTVGKMLEELATFKRHTSNGTHYYELSGGRQIACAYSMAADGGWVATYEDVTERRQAEAKIMHMARHDGLTNLPNRVLFLEAMEEALAREESFAVLFIDLDRFKSVNDTLGHPIGDALLCAVTQRLLQGLRESDIVARLGGDEFAIIQRGAPPAHVARLATRIIEAISEPFDVLGNQVVVGASIGIAVAPTDGTASDQLQRNADMALYRAKAEGRGTYHFFKPEMDAEVQARRALELDLRKALLADEFELYYQPLVDLATNAISGFEALLRWNHPVRGMISPDEFIPVAEDIGLIGVIGHWVLKRACCDAVKWPGELSIAVNLSAVQFRDQTLSLSVVDALGISGLAPARFELEITETVLLQDDRAVLDVLHELRKLGVRISMDDFGKGYSSLGYLRSFPFDKIKIDRSFIQELGKEGDCIAIIRAVIGLGRNLGMVTTAEGVETAEQLEVLRAEGCDQAQGYLFSRPRPASEVLAMIASQHAQSRAA